MLVRTKSHLFSVLRPGLLKMLTSVMGQSLKLQMVQHYTSSEMQPMQPCDQFKDLHGELITAEHSALNLILSAQICKSATDQLIKALLKFLCHSDLSSRTEMKMVVQQNKGQSRDTAAALRWLSTQQNLLPACTFSGQGKITLSTLS